MAQQSKSIDEILQELSKNYKSVLLSAVQKATDIACEDIYNFSMSCIERYYENYIPSSYDRTDSLWRALVPIAEVKNSGNKIVSTVGVEYNPSVLEGVYQSGSEKYGAKKDKDGHIVEYGHPEGSWVLENYLMGIHPTTNGSRNPEDVVYMPVQDSISPHQYTDRYLRLYKNKLNNNVYSYLISHVAK